MTDDITRGRELAESQKYLPHNGYASNADPYADVPPPDDGGSKRSVDVPRLWPAVELHPAAQPRWLAKGRLPRAAISLLIGDEGIGKSLLWVWLAAAVTTGKSLPEFGIPGRDPADVIVVVTEDDWSTAVRPRLEVADADLTRIKVLCIEPDGSGAPTFPLHLPIIAQADPSPALVVVDAWLDTVPAGIQVRDPQQARQALHPWKELATVADSAVLLICHTNRAATPNARDRYGATGALRQKARMTLFAQLDDDGRLTVGPEKSNGSAPIPASAFTITPVQAFAPTADSDGTVPRLDYAGESTMTARQHLAANAHADTDADGDNDDVDRWLVEFLAAGPVRASEVYAGADAAGFSKDKAKRAKKRLDITAVKVGNGPWLWSLDGKGADPSPSPNDRSLAPLPPSQVSEGNQGCKGEQESKSAAEVHTGNDCALADEAVQS